MFLISTILLFNYNKLNLDENFRTLSFIFSAEIFSVILLLFFVNLESILKNKYLISFSKIIAQQTYSVYLFHLIIMHLFLMTDIIYINNIFSYLITLFFLSFIVYKYFELPILKQRPSYENN